MPLQDAAIPVELETLFQSFQKCLVLRDKYIQRSRQRLGDNPKDHDGRFNGLDGDSADVSGVRPDANYASEPPLVSPFKPWKIYPKPPPPHWHWTSKEQVAKQTDGEEDFKFEDCPIPGSHPWCFVIDDKGVYQVYEQGEGGTCSTSCRTVLRSSARHAYHSCSRKPEAPLRCAQFTGVFLGFGIHSLRYIRWAFQKLRLQATQVLGR